MKSKKQKIIDFLETADGEFISLMFSNLKKAKKEYLEVRKEEFYRAVNPFLKGEEANKQREDRIEVEKKEIRAKDNYLFYCEVVASYFLTIAGEE